MDQLIEIIKMLGRPTWEDVYDMNNTYSKKLYAKLPHIKALHWKDVNFY